MSVRDSGEGGLDAQRVFRFGRGSGPLERCRRRVTLRPTATYAAAINYVRFTSTPAGESFEANIVRRGELTGSKLLPGRSMTTEASHPGGRRPKSAKV
jgi:hypothetical protein